MGGVRDGYSNFKWLNAIAPQMTAGLVSIDGETIDRQGYETVTFVHAMMFDVTTSASAWTSTVAPGSALSGYFLRMQHGTSNAAGTVTWSNCQASHMLFDETLEGQMSGVTGLSWGFMAGMDGTSCGSGPNEGTFHFYGISQVTGYISYVESHVWPVGYIGARRWVRIHLSASAAAEVSGAGFAAFCCLGLEADWPVNVIKRGLSGTAGK